MVGAVLAHGSEVVGAGWHAQVGGPHAEAAALAAAGERARGATLYVTLEPCAHHGRTPPCADAVVAAGIARVVACHGDPDPRVAGKGFARLRDAGIPVEVGTLAAQAARLNLRFLVAAIAGRPQVTLKWAMSLDGKIATAGGQSQWISSPRGRRWALAQREEHDAVLVGSGTVLADDPRLDRRLGFAGKPGIRVVLDRRLRLAGGGAAAGSVSHQTVAEPPAEGLASIPVAPGMNRRPATANSTQGVEKPQAAAASPPAEQLQTDAQAQTADASRTPAQRAFHWRLFSVPGPILIYTEAGDVAGRRQLEERGATVVTLPAVEPAAVLADLYARDVRSVLVEGGAEVLASFVASGLYDQVAVDCAPLLIGGATAPGPLGGAGAPALGAAPRLEHLHAQRRGGDLILAGLRQGCLEQLLERVLR